jgi:hypothetical protein
MSSAYTHSSRVNQTTSILNPHQKYYVLYLYPTTGSNHAFKMSEPTCTRPNPDQGRKLDEGDGGIAEDRPERKKSKKEEEEVEPIISSYYNHDDSDITIISSDDVHFKVHASTLRQVS